MDAAEEFDTARVTCTLEDLSVNMTNSRKLGIRALMELDVSVSSFQTETFPEGLQEERGIQVLNRPLKCLHVRAEGRDQCRIHEELELPANKQNIREILWKQVRMQAVLAKPENGKVRIQGELAVFFLYAGEPKTRLEWYEATLPVVCDLEVPQAEAEQICYVHAEVQDWNVQSQEDLEGEVRMLGLDGALKVDYRLYEEQEKDMLEDLYALDRTLIPVRESVHLEQLLMKTNPAARSAIPLPWKRGKKKFCRSAAALAACSWIIWNWWKMESWWRVRFMYRCCMLPRMTGRRWMLQKACCRSATRLRRRGFKRKAGWSFRQGLHYYL